MHRTELKVRYFRCADRKIERSSDFHRNVRRVFRIDLPCFPAGHPGGSIVVSAIVVTIARYRAVIHEGMMSMIFFKAKPVETIPVAVAPLATSDTRKRVEETTAARRKKSDTDGTLRRRRQTVDDNRLL